MSKIHFLSVRVQLLLMALIVALPVAVSILYSGAKLRQQAMEDAIGSTKQICDRIAVEQQHVAASAEQLMIALAQMPDVKQHNAAKVQKILSDILRLNPLYLNISVAHRTGIVWASAISTKPVSMADRRYFKNALASGRLSSGEYVVSRMAAKPTINLCYPFRDETGAIDGVMFIGLRLDLLGQAKAQASQGYCNIISDHRGIILIRDDQPGKFLGKQDRRETFQQMQQGPDAGTMVALGNDGQRRYLAYRKLRLKGESDPYLYIRTSIPVEDATRGANLALAQNLGLFASSLALAFLLAWFIGKRSILDRIMTLQTASRRLAEGDLQVRVSDLVRGGELGSLGQAFDDMAQHLAERERERDRAEKSLRQSENRYRSIFANSLLGIAVTGTDRCFVQVNEAFCTFSEYEEGELIGIRGFIDLTHPDDLATSLEMYQKMVQREVSHYTLEKRYIAKSGRVVSGVLFVEGIYDDEGRCQGSTGCILDVTELKASEERMRLFFERQLVGMAITSPEKGWLKTNVKLCQMLGYSDDEFSAMTWDELIHPADLARHHALFCRLISGEIDEYSLEERMIRKDKAELHLEVSIGCVRRHGGQVDYVLALFNDVTVRKRAEQEISQLQASLEERVLERTSQLEAAIREQESFSYSVSHDLRSPLRHINSYLAILTEDFGAILVPEARYYLERAGAASVKMGKLIDDLLELSRVSRSDLIKETVDLSTLAEGIGAMLQETEPERKVEFVLAPNLFARGDRVLINLVLVNLLGNAWKYSRKTERARLELGVRLVGSRQVFFVKDNGTGFDMAYKDKLFGAFQRLHGEEYDGTGIGLATVSRIMERHGGSVWAEAEPGVGAIFYFSFP